MIGHKIRCFNCSSTQESWRVRKVEEEASARSEVVIWRAMSRDPTMWRDSTAPSILGEESQY